MSKARSSIIISPKTRTRLEMQGYTDRSDRELAGFGPWLRLVPASIAAWTLVATIAGSPLLLLAFVPLSIAGIVLPRHPFDALSNRLRVHGACPIPRSPTQRRFAYALAAGAMLATAASFAVSPPVGRMLGGGMVVMAAGTATTQFCIPAWLWGRAASIVRRPRAQSGGGQCL